MPRASPHRNVTVAGDLLDGGEALGRLFGQQDLADHLVAADAVRLRLASICFSTSGVQT